MAEGDVDGLYSCDSLTDAVPSSGAGQTHSKRCLIEKSSQRNFPRRGLEKAVTKVTKIRDRDRSPEGVQSLRA